MDKKEKEALRRYKKARAREDSSSSSSSSSDSDSGSSTSYSSSDSDRKEALRRHLKKKLARSNDERLNKRDKRDHCQKKLAQRDHIKRKLKEAKLKKRAAAAAAVLTGHSHRSSLSPATQAKLKKLAERKHLRAVSKERREREKLRLQRSRSPGQKAMKIRLHEEAIKHRLHKSPQRVHHQLMSREKIIIQTRTRDRTPSLERERARHGEHKLRHDERRERERERAEREAARDKERAEALARCQERQRERERIAREKLRREEEDKKYSGNGRDYTSREHSLEALERSRHATKRELEAYERECDYMDADRHGILDRDDIRRERDFLTPRRRDLSPMSDRYGGRMRDTYTEDERERLYNRSFHDESPNVSRLTRDHEGWLESRDIRERDLHKSRDYHDADMLYCDTERDRLLRERKMTSCNNWKQDWDRKDWEERGGNAFNSNNKRARSTSEPDWDIDETKDGKSDNKQLDIREQWNEDNSNIERRAWPEDIPGTRNGNNASRGGRGYRERSGYRGHPLPLMQMPVPPPGTYHPGSPRFLNKRNMTYTNPNLIKKQQAAAAAAKAAQASAVVAATTAVAAAKAAAVSAASATTNPGILGQVRQQSNEKPEAGEIIGDDSENKTENSNLEKANGGDLSEISESEDEMLKEADKKSTEGVSLDLEKRIDTVLNVTEDLRVEDVELMDFEEISDGELEEETRFKGVGDALGVDWASLIAETKKQAVESAAETSNTTAKQRWQPHRLIWNMGVSYSLAGEDYARTLLIKMQQQIREEPQNTLKSTLDDETPQTCLDTDENSTQDQLSAIIKTEDDIKPNKDSLMGDLVIAQPLACSQVGIRKRLIENKRIFNLTCGLNGRALSARKDLQLRRQLCGLPKRECNFENPLPKVNSSIKKLAVAAFKRVVQV